MCHPRRLVNSGQRHFKIAELIRLGRSGLAVSEAGRYSNIARNVGPLRQ